MESEKPEPGYLNDKQIAQGLKALRRYIKKSEISTGEKKKKNLLEAGTDESESAKVIVEVVFKNIPLNSKTYIHNVLLPNHWRLELDPEDLNIAIFVKHRQPDTEAEKIQFNRDRDVDIYNTHSYYQKIFRERLDPNVYSRISKIISTKELATEYNNPKQLDKLAKGYDLFLSDKCLMSNKMNSVPRRLGRRFWVREKKVPVMIKLDAKNLEERFKKALSTEPFYVLGRSATEQFQVGIMKQSDTDLIENTKAFMEKLYDKFGDKVRFIRIKSNLTSDLSLPLYADLTTKCK